MARTARALVVDQLLAREESGDRAQGKTDDDGGMVLVMNCGDVGDDRNVKHLEGG